MCVKECVISCVRECLRLREHVNELVCVKASAHMCAPFCFCIVYLRYILYTNVLCDQKPRKLIHFICLLIVPQSSYPGFERIRY